MVRLLLIVLIGYVIYRVARKAFGAIDAPRRETNAGVIDEMVQDPECKTYIPRREARRKVIEGTEYYFCSKECEEKFLAVSREK